MSISTQSDWTLSFGQVEATLGEMISIKASRRSSFQFRLKNLFKVGFLPHTAAGRGKAGAYGVGDLFQLAIAVELMQFDLGPHRILEMMTRLRAAVTMAAGMVGRAFKFEMAIGPNLYLAFDPGGLESLSREFGGSAVLMERVYLDQQPDEIRELRRVATINVSRVAVDLAVALTHDGICDMADFGRLLVAWSDHNLKAPLE